MVERHPRTAIGWNDREYFLVEVDGRQHGHGRPDGVGGVEPTAQAGFDEVVAPLGSGGMGEVFCAQDLRLKRAVALKVLVPDLARDERFRERFLSESTRSSTPTWSTELTLPSRLPSAPGRPSHERTSS